MYSDLSGKFPVQSAGGALYYVSLIDEKIRYAWIRFLRTKDQASKALKAMISEAERQTGRKLKAIRTDNAGEYLAIDDFLKQQGAIHEWTPPYSHESNKLPERFNRTIYTMARSMLAGTKLPRFLWAEALNTATYVKNRLPHQGLERGTTSYKAFHGTKPSIEHL